MIEKQQFEEILKREDLKSFLLNSSKEAIQKAFGEEVANMKDYDQNNPNHQYNLFEHTIEVMEAIPKEKYLSEDYKTLKIAAFFHDIGKPEVAKEKDGKTVYYNHAEKSKEISAEILQKMGYAENEIERILFPAYFGVNSLHGMTAPEFVEKTLISIYYQLKTQLELTLSLSKCTGVKRVFDAEDLDKICEEFIDELPNLQEMLLKDVTANFEGDPAAMSKSEIVLSYPGFYAIFVYRIAHELYKRKVPFVPRMMTEYAHGKTGIDINPGAEIGEYFFIDHGTGIVIGETTKIGKWVKIYQGVTLGALSPRKGQSLSGVKRHPTVEDNVTIYANTTILGGETVIGENSVIGGNSFITSSVDKNSYVSIKAPELIIRTDD